MTQERQRRGLGRGLGSLIPTAPPSSEEGTATADLPPMPAGAHFADLPIDQADAHARLAEPA